MSRRWTVPAALALYALTILLANWLSSHYGMWPMGFGLTASAGTYAAGAALLARDVVQRVAGIPLALAAMAAGIAASFLMADPGVALASAVAFGAAELLDLLVYTPTERRYGWGRAALASNLLSAPVDTVVFLAIAGFPITWASVGGQLAGKLLWVTVVPLVVYAAALHTRRRMAPA